MIDKKPQQKINFLSNIIFQLVHIFPSILNYNLNWKLVEKNKQQKILHFLLQNIYQKIYISFNKIFCKIFYIFLLLITYTVDDFNLPL
jgi:hypothetical protein